MPNTNTIYTHKHHVIPKHAGGTDDPSNIVELTIEEHAEAHRVLYEKYGRWQDKIAWKGLSRSVGKEEINYLKMSLPNRGDNNIMRRSEVVRKKFSDNMKKNNPMTKYPHLNRTAKPIEVLYEDGTIENYTYAKLFSIEKNIPYETIKYIMRNKSKSKKHKIISITQKER